jgi:hypothetical protein|tara:strand:- start:1039 stop:1548 length:510 start_codon:yes stop_codon:yes gene_type:complete
MSNNHLPLIAIGPGCTAASEIPETTEKDVNAVPFPALMYTPIDLEFGGGVDISRRGGRRGARRKASSSRRRNRQSNVIVDFFRAIWYVIKLLLWDLPCCFISCGQEAVDCFKACRGGDSSDEEDSAYERPRASKRSRSEAGPAPSTQDDVDELRAEVERLKQQQGTRRK